MNWLVIDKIIKDALIEDCTYGDITTESVVSSESLSEADLISKEHTIVSGLDVFKRVFELLGDVQISPLAKDGDSLNKGDLICTIKGNTRKMLTGERTALNLIQRMSGIATMTSQFVKELAGTNTKLLDTRKTTPNLRILEKYSAKVGGAVNHRFNLSDGVLIKDNHISAAGGITQAVSKARICCPFVRKIEVEVETLDQVREALEVQADIIMLDNMDIYTMKKAVQLINGKALTEASGNMNLNTIREVAKTGVDYISVGALTHSFKSIDISLKNLRTID